jgi:hypothetical protein
MTSATLPLILWQDPRHYQLGKGELLAQHPHGLRRQLHLHNLRRFWKGLVQLSEVVSSAFSALISASSYHPSRDRAVQNSMSVGGTQVGDDTIAIVFNEFWPDIHRHFSKK